MLDEEFRTGVEVAGSLVEHKTERADINAVARPLTGIKELHVSVLVKSELQSLRGVIHFG